MLRNLSRHSIVVLSRRYSGGGIGKRGESHEEEYFYKKRQEQFQKLKDKQTTEKDFVAERLKQHQEAVEFHKRKIEEYKSGKGLEETKKKLNKM